jgi:RNA polymerase sigma factor for flagellar operon FliA
MPTTSSAAGATSPRQSRSRKKAKSAEKRPTAKARKKLIVTYLPLVRQIADLVHRRLARHRIELDSLTQSGVAGLLEAAQRYDEGRDVAFQDYARHRIDGEIMEYLRPLD